MEKIQYYPLRHSNALVALKAAFLFLFLSASVFTEMQASELPKASSAHRAFEPILNKPNGLPEELIGCFPVLSTTAATGIGASSATTGGNITDDGGSSITARGVAYGTSPEPLIHTSSFTSDGTGTGAFTSQLTGLSPLTTYYVRAYATNSLGTSYGNEVSFTTSLLTIGSNYAGGIVFYVDATGQHGLVCAPSDQGEFPWGCQNTNLGTSNAFGTGMANTLAIVNGCSQRPIAASVCTDLVLNGYDDWYLPSSDELSLMYQNLRTQNLGSFSNTYYWSSSQNSSGSAWFVNFGNGDVSNFSKSYYRRVRAVRAF